MAINYNTNECSGDIQLEQNATYDTDDRTDINNDMEIYEDEDTVTAVAAVDSIATSVLVQTNTELLNQTIWRRQYMPFVAGHERLQQDYSTIMEEQNDASQIQLSSSNHTATSNSNKYVVGTCNLIKKPFIRLTKPAEADEVRPQSLLVFSLANAKSNWEETCNYTYFCDQLKSVRQDITVSVFSNQCCHFKNDNQ